MTTTTARPAAGTPIHMGRFQAATTGFTVAAGLILALWIPSVHLPTTTTDPATGLQVTKTDRQLPVLPHIVVRPRD
jgi:hypothetical protein